MQEHTVKAERCVYCKEPVIPERHETLIGGVQTGDWFHADPDVEANADHHATPAWCPACGSRQVAVDRASGAALCQDCLQHISDSTD
jgi:hypothetical protein